MGCGPNKHIVKNALFMLACCGQARNLYKRLRFIVPKKLGYHLVRVFCLPKKYGYEAFGYLLESKNNLILVFKGTSIRAFDLSIDLNLYQTKYPFISHAGKTHEGFTYLYSCLRSSILSTLCAFDKHEKRSLYVTGYSLGGAIATIAALDISKHTPFRNPKVYTFGSPRVGDPVFAMTYDRRIKENIRVVNVHDYIPLEPQAHIKPPFTKKGLNYQHVKGYFPISFQCKKGNFPLKFPLLKNHQLDRYFSTLAQFVPKYTEQICQANPRFCPSIQNDSQVNFLYTETLASAPSPK
ncbi:lipase family protein [Shimazuella sp. AN120528]|nr:lipase family protein [Shimazuella soli]